MIIDNIKNADLYKSIHPRFEAAFDFLCKTDLAALENGVHEIDGKNLFAAVTEAPTKTKEQVDLEGHDYYVDIQYIISGRESMGYRPMAGLEVKRHDVERDIIFVHDAEDEVELKLGAGDFAIFFPQDAHRPNLINGEQVVVKKVVVKVKI